MNATIRRLSYGIAALILAGALITIGALMYTSSERRQHDLTASTGATLYAENCASCHGIDLKGEADWQSPNSDGTLPAPPHDESGHTWHHTDELLVNYIKLGGAAALEQEGVTGFKSGMPAYGNVLSDAQIDDVLDFIKSHWSDEVQQIQKERSESP